MPMTLEIGGCYEGSLHAHVTPDMDNNESSKGPRLSLCQAHALASSALLELQLFLRRWS